MPTRMTEKLFVHINNDPFLKGSFGLEGHQFGLTISYLQEHVADIERNGRDVSEEVRQLLRSCTELMEFERTVANSSDPNHIFKATQAMTERTLSLKQGEALLLPGGWMDDTSGHAMIYQIVLDKEGNYLFKIHNSGAGIQYHAKRDEKDRLTFNPVLTYKIPKDKMNGKNFSLILKKLMEARVTNLPKSQPMNADYLYQGVFQLLEGHLGAKIVMDENETYHAYTAGQISGTCTERSLHQMLKSSFKEKDDYRRFIYRFKARSLDDYWQVLTSEGALQNPQRLVPVEKAIRHQLRLLNLKKTNSPTEDLFSKDEKARDMQKLQRYLEEIRRHTLNPAPQRRVQQAETSVLIRRPIAVQQPPPVHIPDIKAYLRDEAPPVMPIQGGEHLLAEMDMLITKCHEWRTKGQYYTLFEQLEYFITHLPVTKPLNGPLLPYYQDISNNTKFYEFLKKLNILQSEYFSSGDALFGKGAVLPRQYIAKLSLLAVTAHINSNNPIHPTGQPFCGFMRKLYSILDEHASFLATDSPSLDERLQEVKSACKTLPCVGELYFGFASKEQTNYYLEILNSEPELKQKLEEMYQRENSAYFNETLMVRDFEGRMQPQLSLRAIQLKNVNNHHCEAMYYLTVHWEELKRNQTFNSLFFKWDIQRTLEDQYSSFTHRLSAMPEPETSTPWLHLKVNEDDFEVSTPVALKMDAIKVNDQLLENKYAIPKSIALNAVELDCQKKKGCQCLPGKNVTDSHIQLLPGPWIHNEFEDRATLMAHQFGLRDLEARELYHLRQSKNTQILITLDYFNRHIEKLNQSNYQKYIEANLFQPMLLKTQLSSKPEELFKVLEKFIDNGLDIFQQNTQLQPEAIFFIRMGYLVYQYANALDSKKFKPRLQGFLEKVNVLISAQEDTDILTCLHLYRFQTMVQLGVGQDGLQDVIASYFHLQSHAQGAHQLDKDSLFQYQMLKHEFVRQMKSKAHLISDEMVLALINTMGIRLDSGAPKIKKAYPLFFVQQGKDAYTLNMETGLIFKEALAYTTTPVNLLTHRVTKTFGLDDQTLCYTSADSQIFLLEKPPHSLRFIREGTGFRVQKKWRSPLKPSIEQWYELTPLEKTQAIYWETGMPDLQNFYSKIDGLLPTIFSEQETTIWRSVDDETFLVVDEKRQIICSGDGRTGVITDCRKNTPRGLLCQSPSWIHLRLSHVEDVQFINVWALADGGFLVDLPRYGLQLKVQKTGIDQWSFIYELDGMPYILNQSASNLGEGVAQLIFEHQNDSFGLFPIQAFINTGSRSEITEYHHLMQDIGCSILNKRLPGNPIWQYTGSERMMRIKMENGVPKPTTTEEGLFLTYLYLCSNQPEKAWAMLEQCHGRLGGLLGNYEELKYLHWIIDYMPYPLKDKDLEAVVMNPQQITCKLKALALLSEFTRRTDKKIKNPPLKFPETTTNGQDEQKRIDETGRFYAKYHHKIYDLFKNLQGVRRELQAAYTLKDSETKSLLDDYHDNVNPNSVETGALGYERVQLRLNLLKQEWVLLLAKIQTQKAKGQTPLPYDVQRLKTIETFIEKHESIARTTTKLAYVEVSISCGLFLVQERGLPEASRLQFKDPAQNIFDKPYAPEHHQNMVDSLSLATTDEWMLKNFHELLFITLTPHHALKPQLLTFCKAVLIASRNMTFSLETDNMPLFCDVLARIAMATDAGLAGALDLNSLKAAAGVRKEFEWVPSRMQYEYVTKPQSTSEALNKVIAFAKTLKPLTPVSLPTLQDETKSILATPIELWHQTPTRALEVKPEVLTTQKKPRVTEWLSARWLEKRRDWLALENVFQSAEGGALARDVDTKGLSEQEYQAGATKYQSLKDLQAFSEKTLSDEGELQDIQNLSSQKVNILETAQEALEAEILALASEGPGDPTLKEAWKIDVLSGKRRALDIHGLLTLYFHADQNRYARETGLSAGKINELHEKLVQYVASGIQLQQCERVQTQLDALRRARSDEDKRRLRYVLAQAIFGINRVDVVDDPTLSLFQLYEDKLLRAQQQEALDRFLTKQDGLFDESIEKIIMGGGKSKVILPTLAQKKADGTNLVLLEVPRALLRTNYVDLKATSSSLFHQDAYLFEFSRDSKCTAERLEQLYDEFTDVMVNKRYVVTTGEAMQSLELKYIELLNDKPTKPHLLQDWKKRVLWAERLVSLVKHRGDVIIDEVHQGLLLKTKLNYTIGEPTPLPTYIIQHAVEMYRFFKYVDIGGCFIPPLQGSYSLEEAIATRDEFTEPLNIKTIMRALVQQLMTHQKSPLFTLLSNFKIAEHPELAREITEYLSGESTAVPDIVRRASAETKQQLAFYKEQISNMLPFTLKRHQGEHFGPSKKVESPIERLRAIPYSANNVPSEQSRFGNYLETVDYTIQSLLITGVDADVVRKLIESWLTEAYTEVRALRSKSLENTPTADRFNALAKGRLSFKFCELKHKNDDQLQEITEKLGRDPQLIYEVLKEYVLPTIKTNDTILQSNAYSHVDLMRTCQSMSGTPWNRSTFHQRLHYSAASGRGTDGYVVRAIEEKRPFIRAIDFENSKSFIESILSPSQQPTTARAIIDISASFKGVSNISVARELARYIHAHPLQFSEPEPVKFVLFFHEGVLSALKVQEHVEAQTPISIGSSEPENIRDKLGGCSPYGRFTFYDQEHTVGTDVKQGMNSKAMVLVDTMTQSQHFLQGAMRMRELIEGNQTLDIIVPKVMKNIPLDTLLTQMVQREVSQLQQDNFNAARLRLRNMIRADLRERLLQFPEEETELKHEFLQHAFPYFFEEAEKDFFKRFGGVDETRTTEDLLRELQGNLLKDWQKILASLGIEAKNLKKMQIEMDKVVEAALKPGVCAAHQVTRKGEMGVEVEVQQEQQVEVQVEVEQLVEREVKAETYDPYRFEIDFVKWSIDQNGKISDDAAYSPNFLPLKEICQVEGSKSPEFSLSISASQNFYANYHGEKKHVGMFLKPAHALLFIQEGENLRCIILTQKECENLCASYPKDASWWITTTQHTTLLGTPPPKICERHDYQSIIEQVRFFNGEFNLLLRRDSTLRWMEEDSEEKIKYFKEHLLQSRETQVADIVSLQKYFVLSQQVFIAISKKPWEDKTSWDWAALYKGCSKEDIEDYQAAAKAFQFMTEKYSENLDAAAICEAHHVSASAVAYVRRYIEQLGALKILLASYKTKDFSAVTPEVRAQLIALCPEMEPHLMPDKLSFELPCFLLQTLPMCNEHPDLLRALAIQPRFYSEDLPKPFIFDALLAMASQSLIPRDKYLLVMQKVLGQMMSANILEAFLADSKIDLPMVLKLIAPIKLNDKQISLILKRKADLGSQILFDELLKKASTPSAFAALKEHPMYSKIKVEDLQRLMMDADAEMLTAYLQHPNVDEAMFESALEHSKIGKGSLAWIAENTTKVETLTLVLNHPWMREASVERDRVYLASILTPAFSTEALLKFVPNLRDENTVNALISRIEKDASDEFREAALRRLIANLQTPFELLGKIIQLAGNKLDMKALLERDDLQCLNEDNIHIFKSIFRHPSLQTKQVLERMFMMLKDSPECPVELLERLSTYDDLLLETKRLLVHHPKASLNVLGQMLAKDEQDEFLNYLLTHPLRDKLSVDERLERRFEPYFNRLKATQFFEDDIALDNCIAFHREAIRDLKEVKDIAQLETTLDELCAAMKSREVSSMASLMLKFERFGKDAELQKLQQLLRTVPLEERQKINMSTAMPRGMFFGKTPKEKKGDELLFQLRRLGMSNLEQQANFDWEHLYKQCQTKGPEFKKAYLIAQIRYVLHHLEEKKTSLKLEDPSIDELVGSFKTLVSHVEKGNAEGVKTSMQDAKIRMETAKKGPVVKKFRYFEGILQILHDALLAIKFWQAPEQRQTYFDKRKTKSHQLIYHLDERLQGLSDTLDLGSGTVNEQ